MCVSVSIIKLLRSVKYEIKLEEKKTGGILLVLGHWQGNRIEFDFLYLI